MGTRQVGPVLDKILATCLVRYASNETGDPLTWWRTGEQYLQIQGAQVCILTHSSGMGSVRSEMAITETSTIRNRMQPKCRKCTSKMTALIQSGLSSFSSASAERHGSQRSLLTSAHALSAYRSRLLTPSGHHRTRLCLRAKLLHPTAGKKRKWAFTSCFVTIA